MPLHQVLVLALVQGITEFLPISSTAHLILVPWLFGWRDPGLTFDVALHVGTLAAVVVYFARTWFRLLGLVLGRRLPPPGPGEPDQDLHQNPRLFWFLVAATLPAALAGLLLERFAETSLRSPFIIAVMMISVAALMWRADRTGRFQKDLGGLSLADSLLIGLAQAAAIVPGASRSGTTIAAALFLGVRRSAAARFSFLLSTPIIAGAVLKAGWNILSAGGVAPEMRAAFALGILVSGASGYAAISFLVRYLQLRTMQVFVAYRILCGIMILALAIFFRDPVPAL